jgi:hypothetical protein
MVLHLIGLGGLLLITHRITIHALSELLEYKATERRLRCAAHIFNLVAHSIPFATDNANLEQIGDAIYDDDILSLELAKWRL